MAKVVTRNVVTPRETYPVSCAYVPQTNEYVAILIS